MAQMGIATAEPFPKAIDSGRLGIGTDPLELPALVSRLGGGDELLRHVGLRILVLNRSRIPHTVQCRSRPAAADRKIHPAVWAEGDVGHIERLPLEEGLGPTGVARAARRRVHGEDASI